jgi:hypothetical protein
VLDLVGVNPILSMAAKVARVLGYLTIVGVGNAALPVNFSSPPHECAVASPFWGSIPELIEVITLAQAGKIKMHVEHFPLERAAEALRLAAPRQDQWPSRHHAPRLAPVRGDARAPHGGSLGRGVRRRGFTGTLDVLVHQPVRSVVPFSQRREHPLRAGHPSRSSSRGSVL